MRQLLTASHSQGDRECYTVKQKGLPSSYQSYHHLPALETQCLDSGSFHLEQQMSKQLHIAGSGGGAGRPSPCPVPEDKGTFRGTIALVDQ